MNMAPTSLRSCPPRARLPAARQGRIRGSCLIGCALAVFVALPVAQAAGARGEIDVPRAVEDPHYGDALFSFFQERYFTSVTDLMVSQHFNRVSHHVDDAEILRGGLLLSFGLHREAGEIFAALVNKGARPSVRDRAWFFLAKVRYQRGLFADAETAIDKVGDRLPADLEEDRALLKAQLLMQRGDNAAAAKVLDGVKGKKGPPLYARYNLGVALIRGGDVARGSELLDKIGQDLAPTQEQRALRDRANVALGFAALQTEQPADARKYLERVRLQGMQSNKALLAFGWAAATMKQPRLALIPWTELAQRDASDAAVLEARIAIAYAYAELGAYGQSLDRYNEAIEVYKQENVALDESITAIRAGKLVSGLIEQNPSEEMGWFWNITRLPEMPHAGHLGGLLAQHEFQESFKNYRDLRFLDRNLSDWLTKLNVFGDMLANRRQAFAERLPKVREQAGAINIDANQRHHEALTSELQKVEADTDAAAFANGKQRELMARLQRVRTLLAATGNDPELAGQRERLRRVAGALSWQLAQDFPDRAWKAKRDLKIAGDQLRQARERDAALAAAQRDEPARFEAFAKRMAELDQRIRLLQPRVAALSREQQEAVQAIAVAELTRQKERLAEYNMQARFALAQLYDRAGSSDGKTEGGSDARKP